VLWLCMFALAVGAHSTGVFYLPSAYFELQRMRLIGGAMAYALPGAAMDYCSQG
jgi:hypothetical protein